MAKQHSVLELAKRLSSTKLHGFDEDVREVQRRAKKLSSVTKKPRSKPVSAHA